MSSVVISDVHIGTEARTCWYRRSVHEPYLAAVLDYVIERPRRRRGPVTQLVVLGDLFDFWTYPPDQRPPTIDDIIEANQPILGPEGKLRAAVDAIGGNVILLRGNHDIQITQEQLDHLSLGDHRIELVDDLIVGPHGIVLTHGHLFTMFNAPDERYPDDVPVGHFVSRAIAHYLETSLAAGADGSGPARSRLSLRIRPGELRPRVGAALASPSVTSTLLDYMANRCGLSTSAPIVLADGSTTTIDEAKQKYDGLWTAWVERYGGGEAGETVAGKAAQADYDGTYIAWFAQKACFDHGARGVITGHTHHPKEGIRNSRCLYVNGGFECPSVPDIGGNRTQFNFAVITADGTPQLWSVTDDHGSYCVRQIDGEPDQIMYEPFSDFSCYVTIDNSGSQDLVKVSDTADNGYYVSAPPQTIAAGDTAEIWLQDFAGIHGGRGEHGLPAVRRRQRAARVRLRLPDRHLPELRERWLLVRRDLRHAARPGAGSQHRPARVTRCSSTSASPERGACDPLDAAQPVGPRGRRSRVLVRPAAGHHLLAHVSASAGVRIRVRL